MKQIKASVFRLTFTDLDEAVQVTVNGKVVGQYMPISAAIDQRYSEEQPEEVKLSPDDVLRRMRKKS